MRMLTAKNDLIKVLRRLSTFARLFIGLTLLTACGSLAIQPTEDTAPFLPPTLSAVDALSTQAPPPTFAASTPWVTPTLPCSNNLAFVSDVTFPDGSKVTPGAILDKRWQVRNTGTCNWDARYHFKLVEGDAMGVASDQALYPARAGSEAILRLVFTAPPAKGTYRSAWQAFGADGKPFGSTVYVEVVVTRP